jgi:hypothetical protein
MKFASTSNPFFDYWINIDRGVWVGLQEAVSVALNDLEPQGHAKPYDLLQLRSGIAWHP